MNTQSVGIKVNVSIHNDPKDIQEVHKPDVIRAYQIGRNKVSFKKPKKEDCLSVICFSNEVTYGVVIYKIENWEELPEQLPYDENILKSYFFDAKVIVV